MEDYKYDMGEKVVVGTTAGVVVGQANYAYEPDEFQLLLIDDDGLPFKEWFAEHMISHLTKH